MTRASKQRTRASESGATPRIAVDAIRDAELDIIDAVIDKALEGSYQHAKFLFDYVGLSHQPGSEQSEPSLAQVLLERLGLEEEAPQADVRGDSDGHGGT